MTKELPALGKTTLVGTLINKGDYYEFHSRHGVLMFDCCDLPVLKGWRWECDRGYFKRRNYGGRPRRLYLHRVLVEAPSHLCVDHINGDRLDNRRSNLRLSTHAENIQNRRGATAKSSTGYRGVYFSKEHRRYYARVVVGGKHHNLGFFDSASEANKAVRKRRAILIPHSQ